MGIFMILVGAALICLVVFGSFASIFILPSYFRSRDRAKLQDNIRAAIEQGQPLPPELVDTLSRDFRRPASRSRDIRWGVIWLAIAGGIVGVGLACVFGTDWDGSTFAFGLAAIPGFVGLALLVLGLTNKDKS